MKINYIIRSQSPKLIRDIEIAVEFASGKRQCDIAKKYNLSKTRVHGIYCKMGRTLIFSISHSDLYEEEKINLIEKIQNDFQSPEVLQLMLGLKNHILRLEKESIYHKYINVQDEETFIIFNATKKIKKLLEKLEKRREIALRNIENEFNVLKNQIIEILSELKIKNDLLSDANSQNNS